MKSASSFLSLFLTAALVMAFTASDAKAANLFDMLFGGNKLNQPKEKVEKSRPKPRARKVVRKKRAYVRGPTYYTYKVDKPSAVDFSPIVKSASASASLVMLDDHFSEAVRYLGNYELVAPDFIAKALTDFYSDEQAFVWVSGMNANGKAAAARAVLNDADSWGLSATDYQVTFPGNSFDLDDMPARLKELVRFEMAMSARVLLYAHDAQQGRVDPNRLSGYHDLPRKKIDLVSNLEKLDESDNVEKVLSSFHPANTEFALLRAELAKLRASKKDEIVIDPETFIRPEQVNNEFPKVLAAIAAKATPEFMAEYGELLEQHRGELEYGSDLVVLVKAAQKEHSLSADGVIGKRTVAKLTENSRAVRLDRVLLAMERLRWLPSDLGNTHVFINQPAYQVSFNSGDTEVLTMRAVVGTTRNQTSFFQDEIERVVYNPYWGVPQSIIVNEMLPRLIRDPGYLDRSGYEVSTYGGKRIASSSVNWGAYGSRIPFNVRQKPGSSNALGELKILFPNKHAIYMHDTPAKKLFQRDRRALSHGCVRLERPREMAAAVLGTTTDEIAARLSEGHSFDRVTTRIPVYIAYFTAWPDDKRTVVYYDDVYERDVYLKKALAAVEGMRSPAS